LADRLPARGSWNYTRDSCTSVDDLPQVTYWMNRLQGFEADDDYLVTLNATDQIKSDDVLASMDYEHPIYTAESVAAQSKLSELATDRTIFAGAYHGWGFHEDGCVSGVRAAEHFGATW